MKSLAALLLLFAVPAWASPAADAEHAAERVLLAQNVLSYHLTANEAGRLTLLFGKFVADWQMDAVVKQLEQEPAIKGLTHIRVDTDFCTMR
jgi:hypothetical protein